MLNHVLLPSSHCVTYPAMQARLNKLFAERARPGSDKPALDRLIWDLYGERWAVMFTDLAGFSRQVEDYGITHFMQVIFESFRVHIPVIEEHAGVVFKVEGDSMMVLFRKPANAMRCAEAMMEVSDAYNADRPEAEKLVLSIGLGYGDVLKFGDQDVYGQEVNVACKLGEDLGEEYAVQVSHDFHLAVQDDGEWEFVAAEACPLGTPHAWKLKRQG